MLILSIYYFFYFILFFCGAVLLHFVLVGNWGSWGRGLLNRSPRIYPRKSIFLIISNQPQSRLSILTQCPKSITVTYLKQEIWVIDTYIYINRFSLRQSFTYIYCRVGTDTGFSGLGRLINVRAESFSAQPNFSRLNSMVGHQRFSCANIPAITITKLG